MEKSTLLSLPNTIEAIEAIEKTQTKEALLEALKTFLEDFGVEHVGIGQLVNPAMATKALDEYGVNDFPKEFTNTWFSERRIMHDPVARYAANVRKTFTWDIAGKYATEFGKRMLEDARDMALENGIGIPVIIPKMPLGLVTMSHSSPDVPEHSLSQIELVSIHAYAHFLDLTAVKSIEAPRALTIRETEVLHYVAAGRTNWEIGQNLGISEETVRVHTKNIMRKLHASNRAHSVTLAINNGTIIP